MTEQSTLTTLHFSLQQTLSIYNQGFIYSEVPVLNDTVIEIENETENDNDSDEEEVITKLEPKQLTSKQAINSEEKMAPAKAEILFKCYRIISKHFHQNIEI